LSAMTGRPHHARPGAIAAALVAGVCLSGCAARDRVRVAPAGTSASIATAGTGRPGVPLPREVPVRSDAPALEQIDGDLAASLRDLAADPSAVHHRIVAA